MPAAAGKAPAARDPVAVLDGLRPPLWHELSCGNHVEPREKLASYVWIHRRLVVPRITADQATPSHRPVDTKQDFEHLDLLNRIELGSAEVPRHRDPKDPGRSHGVDHWVGQAAQLVDLAPLRVHDGLQRLCGLEYGLEVVGYGIHALSESAGYQWDRSLVASNSRRTLAE